MKISKRYLFFNKYILICLLVPTISSFFSWAVFSEYFSALFIWDLSAMSVTRQEYFEMIFPFYNYPSDGFSMIQLILPVFPMLFVIPFLNLKKNLVFSYPRIKSYKRAVLQTVSKHLLYGCFVLFFSYLIFLLIGVALLPMTPNPGVPGELFSEFLGENFYQNHMLLYFVLEGFIKYFIFPFIYGLLAIAISFLTPKNYLCILIPIAYYAVLAVCVAILESAFRIDILFLSPTYTVVASSRPYTNIFVVLAPLLPPLMFSIAVIVRDMVKTKNRGDVFAIA